MKKCENCPVEFQTTVKTRNKKYCDICRILVWNKQKSTRKDFDLFCLDCNESLPIGSKADKMFCSSCARRRVKIQHNNHYMNRKNREILNKFYKNLQYNLIQSPYFIEQGSGTLTGHNSSVTSRDMSLYQLYIAVECEEK